VSGFDLGCDGIIYLITGNEVKQALQSLRFATKKSVQRKYRNVLLLIEGTGNATV
jgi:hypothetical protein